MNTYTRRALLGSLCLAGLAGGVSCVAAPGAPAGSRRREFVVFDGLLYKPMPDLRSMGMPKLLGVGNIWRPGQSHEDVDPAGVAEAVKFVSHYTENYYFDVENWYVSSVAQSVIDANIQKMVSTAEIARRTSPAMKFGIYNVAPQGTYWPVVLKNTDALKMWRDVNRRSAAIAGKVDYLFPSLYTFYNDPAGWETAARGIMQEARQYGKPVYPFLWPEFHDSNATLRGTKIPRDFWRRELEVCREYADGLVLWGGYTQLWDEQADWWLETKLFMESLASSMKPRPSIT